MLTSCLSFLLSLSTIVESKDQNKSFNALPSSSSYLEEAQRIAKQMPLDFLIGQLMMPVTSLVTNIDKFESYFRDYHVGGVIVDGMATDSIPNVKQHIRNLTDRIKAAGREQAQLAGFNADPIISSDQEFGRVARIRAGVSPLPSAMALGALRNSTKIQQGWEYAAHDLRGLGLNMDFAPIADVQIDANNPVIGSRSFGDIVQNVSECVSASVRGMQRQGLGACLKHFPGHGNTSTDSHHDLPVLSQSKIVLMRIDLPPFMSGMRAGAKAVMIGHLDVECLHKGIPSSLSPKVTTDFLQKDLGWTNLILTDSLAMAPAKMYGEEEAAVLALLAGNDILLMPNSLAGAKAGIEKALKSGRLTRELLEARAAKIIAYRLEVSSYPQPTLSEVATADKIQYMEKLHMDAITMFRGVCRGASIQSPVYVSGQIGFEKEATLLQGYLRELGFAIVSTAAGAGSNVRLVGAKATSADLDPSASVTVAMDLPYILAKSRSRTLVATYSTWPVALSALAKALAGKVPMRGYSPVAVSDLPRSVCVS